MVGGTYEIFAMSFALAHALRMKFGFGSLVIHSILVLLVIQQLFSQGIISYSNLYTTLLRFSHVFPLWALTLFSPSANACIHRAQKS